MPLFSDKSRSNLETCHAKLKAVMEVAIEQVNFTVYEGHRDKETQNKYYEEGKSQLQYPESKHNKYPSLAVDVVPYVPGHGVIWDSRELFGHLGGRIMQIASHRDIGLRWGNDWDQDGVLINFDDDNDFYDPGHFELRNP